MRTYQPLWETLKSNGTVSLVASPSLHRRIIKAVYKERDKDLAHKLQLAETSQRSSLRHTAKGSLLTLDLTIEPLRLSQLSRGDL